MAKSLVGVNLEGLSYWCRNWMYADAIKSSQVFLDQNNKDWIGATDANGWPTQDCNFLLFTNEPHSAGTYKFSCTGKCTLSVSASNAVFQNVAYDPNTNTTTADLVNPANTIGQIGIFITNTTGGVKNIKCIRPGCTADQRFNPAFIKLVQPFGAIRFMDFLNTNGNPLVNWADRPKPQTAQYTLGVGAPIEDAIAFAAACGTDAWLNVPCLASDDFINQFAALLKQIVPSGMRVYIEYSNEVWNYGFPEWKQNFDAAQTEAKTDTTLTIGGTSTDVNMIGFRRTAKKLMQICKALQQQFGSAYATTIRPVMAGQCGNPYISQVQLDYINRYYGPPAQTIYGTAIAPYFGCDDALKGSTTLTIDQLCNNLLQNANVMTWIPNGAQYVQAHLALAKQYNIPVICYESGLDLGQQNVCVDVKTQAQYDPRTGQAIYNYLQSWFANEPNAQIMYFTLTAMPNQWGYWGLTDEPDDATQTKYVNAAKVAALHPDPTAPTPTPPSPPPPPPPPAPSGPAAVGDNFTMNCGTKTDWLVPGWLADHGVLGGDVVDRGNITIANTSTPQIYQTEHFGMQSYTFDVDNGNYNVTLHFCETYNGVTAAGQRVFDVSVNGVALNGFDPFAVAGGRQIAITKTFAVQVTDGMIHINFTPHVQLPQINGIEVLQVVPQKTPANVVLNYSDGSTAKFLPQ